MGIFSRLDKLAKGVTSTFISPAARELERPFVTTYRGIQGLAGNHRDENKPVNTPFGEVKPFGSFTEQASGKSMKAQGALTGGEAAGGAADLLLSVPGAAEEAVAKGGELAGKALGPLAEPASKLIAKGGKALKASAAKTFEEGLAPTKVKFKTLASKVAPQAIEEGMVGSLKSISKKAQAGVEKMNEAFNNFGKLKGKISLSPIIDEFEKAKQEFMVAGKVVEPQKLANVEHFQSIVKSLADEGGNLEKEDLRALRRVWDKSVYAGEKAIGKTLEEGSKIDIQKKGVDAIRKLLAESEPELAKINAKFNFYKNLGATADATLARRVGQSNVVKKGVGQIIGAGIGHMVSKLPIIGELIGAKLGEHVASLGGSTLWKTTSAAVRNKAADAMLSGVHDPAAIASFFRKAALPEIKMKDLVEFLNSEKSKISENEKKRAEEAATKRVDHIRETLYGGNQPSKAPTKLSPERAQHIKDVLFNKTSATNQ